MSFVSYTDERVFQNYSLCKSIGWQGWYFNYCEQASLLARNDTIYGMYNLSGYTAV